jgi:hypothetical protein
MVKSNTAANVIDLEAFRQRKMREERGGDESSSSGLGAASAAMVVPVWFCWVPLWTPFVG